MADKQAVNDENLTRIPSGSGDLHGSLSIPKDLELAGNVTHLASGDTDLGRTDANRNKSDVTEKKTESPGSDDSEPPVKPLRVPLAKAESLSDPTCVPYPDREMELSAIAEVSFDSPDGASDIDTSAYSECQPMLRKQNSAGIATSDKPMYDPEKPPVEMILIDRSASGREDPKNMIRIDEHMNISLYTAAPGSRRAVIGIISFCALLLVTSLVIILANR